MLTILSIIGARPQFIKHARLQRQLQKHFNALTLHTGQHYDANMSGMFFEELGIGAPEYMLDLSSSRDVPQGAQTGAMMAGIEKVCGSLKPEAVLLYGDTNSTLAGALVAAKLCIPIVHVEAGIRSYNRTMPEEVNRIIADTFSSILLCPVPEAVDNLRKEGIDHDGICLSGDVMCDMLEAARPYIRQIESMPYYFATIHRPYNTDDPARMTRILRTLDGLEHPVIFPLHPRTQGRLEGAGIQPEDWPHIHFMPPVGYADSISYQHGAQCIITDSGGVQKEAYMLRKQCITLRSETEWTETLRHGWNTLVFKDIESINRLVYITPGEHVTDMFGDGHAAERIVSRIRDRFSSR